MPKYKVICTGCETQSEVIGRMGKPLPLCKECGCEQIKQVVNSHSGSMMVGMTPTKAAKINKEKKEARAKRDKISHLKYSSKNRLSANVDGQFYSSWEEARHVAKEAGKDASSFDSHVAKEKRSNNMFGADEAKLR